MLLIIMTKVYNNMRWNKNITVVGMTVKQKQPFVTATCFDDRLEAKL